MSIRIAIGARSLLTPLTGVGQYTLNLSRQFVKLDGVEAIWFLGYSWRDTLPKAPSDTETGVTLQKRLRRILTRSIPVTHDLARIVSQGVFSAGSRGMRADIYHEPNFIPFRFKGPTIVTIHDLSIIRFPETHPVDRARAIGQKFTWAIERADAIITVSHFVRNELIDKFGVDEKKVFAIHNGVSETYRPRVASEIVSVMTKYGLTYGRYLLAVGTLEPRKNLSRLCRAYSSLPEQLKARYPLIIVGMKGWGVQDQDDIEILQRENQIIQLGYLEDRELQDIYAGACLFVYPSLYEGFGLPVLEAMSAGIPVMASNTSAMPEVSGDAALLVDPFDVDGIRWEIESLLNDLPRRDEMSRLGLENAGHFSWEKCATETLNVYRQVMNARG